MAFAVLFLVSGIRVLRWYRGSRQSQLEFAQLAELVGRRAAAVGISGEAEEETELTVLEEYAAIYEKNPDFAGWIQIEGTTVDYPVMQSVEEPDFYLRRNFDGNYSIYGVPYIQADCDLLTSDNLVIYGHHMDDGTMFAALCDYMDEEFYKAHRIIRFDTWYSHGSYEVIAAFKTVGTQAGFAYHHFVDAGQPQEFDAFVAACRERTPYEMDATASYGDRLITLSTCEYTRYEGRMVVVAKKIA